MVRRILQQLIVLTILSGIYGAHEATADTREIMRMENIEESVKPETLVVFDIDNTLMEPVQTLGSDQWYGYRVNTHESEGMSHKDAIAAAIREWQDVELRTEVEPVETSTPALITRLQDKGVTVMALTARAIDFAATTQTQLGAVGIELTRSAPTGSDLNVPGENPSLYTHGILFVGPYNEKGPVLAQFLHAVHLNPTSVVFVDDKAKHVGTVGAALAPLGVEYHGFRYGATDALVASFDRNIADVEFRYFLATGRILSDDQARRIQ
jgi:hypothetical protein